MSILSTEEQNLKPNPPETPVNPMDELIVRGSLWRAIWEMSWPLYLNMMVIAIASFSEIYVAGRMGSSVQAAIGIGGQIWFFMIMLVVALSAGTNALVSRFWGAGEKENAVIAARQSLMFSVFFGAFSATVGLLICRPLLRLLGANSEVEQLGWDFLKYDILSQVPLTTLWVANSIFRAKGNTKTPMITMFMVVAGVVSLNWILCIEPFQFGISGLGMSWVICSTFGLIYLLFALRRSDIGHCMDLNGPGLSKEWFLRLMRIGLPACIQDLAWVGGNFVLLRVLAYTHNATASEAAWGIGLRVEEMLGGMPIYALGTAVGTIVGQNLGAKQPERAELAGWKVTALACVYNVVVAVGLFFGADALARVMTSDPLVISYSADYFRIVGLSQPLVAAWIVLVGAMQGAGYTKWPMVATVICLVFIRLPLAWFLSIQMNMGPAGTWVSLAVSSLLVGIAMIWRFRTGIWKVQQV